MPGNGAEDPLSLMNATLSLLAAHEDAARHGGVRVHTMRRQLEAAVAAYRRAEASGDAAATAEALEAANRRAAGALAQIVEASMRLLTDVKERAERDIAAMERGRGRKRR